VNRISRLLLELAECFGEALPGCCKVLFGIRQTVLQGVDRFVALPEGLFLSATDVSRTALAEDRAVT